MATKCLPPPLFPNVSYDHHQKGRVLLMNDCKKEEWEGCRSFFSEGGEAPLCAPSPKLHEPRDGGGGGENEWNESHRISFTSSSPGGREKKRRGGGGGGGEKFSLLRS